MSETTTLSAGVTLVRDLNVSIAYSGVEVGNMDLRFGEPQSVQSSREKLLSALSPVRYVVQAPLGGSEFVDLTDIPDEEIEDAYLTDGLFINRPGVALGLNAADCIPMALYSEDNSALGVIHAGRKGVEGGIHTAAVEHMESQYEVAAEDIRVFFGPSIQKDSYYYPEISAEQLEDPEWDGFIERRGDNYHIDLVGRTKRDLVEHGIRPAYIQVPDIDVGAEDSGFFSHTRSSRTGEPEARNGFVAVARPH